MASPIPLSRVRPLGTVREQSEHTGLHICGICQQNMLGRQPKDLPCTHTFCTECIDGLISGSRFCSTVKCPVCQTESSAYKGVSTFNDNVHLTFMASVDESSSLPECKGCAISGLQCLAKYHCAQCNIDMCKNCELKHKSRFNKSRHVVYMVQKNRHQACKQHEEKVTHFCLDCSLMVCSICVLYDSHTDHNIKHIEDYCKGFKQTLPVVKSQLEEKYKKAREIHKKTKECQVASDKARRLIEDSCEELKSLVDRAATQFYYASGKYQTQINKANEDAEKVIKEITDILTCIQEHQDQDMTADEVVALLENIQFTNKHSKAMDDVKCMYPIFNKNTAPRFGEIAWIDITKR